MLASSIMSRYLVPPALTTSVRATFANGHVGMQCFSAPARGLCHTHTRTQGSDCGSLPGHISIGDDCLFEIGSIVQTLFLSSVFKHITRQELQTCTELYLLGHDRKLPCRLRLAPQSCTAKPCTGLEQECTCRHSERIVITTFGKRTYTPRIAYFSTSISKLFTYPSEPQQLPAPLRSQRDPNPTSSPSMQTK